MQPETQPRMRHDHVQVTVRLPKSMMRQIDHLAARQFSCRAAVVRRMLHQAAVEWSRLDEHENR
jgi:metal-responsive CopG/Arc/MetJ family transcriptional regulator